MQKRIKNLLNRRFPVFLINKTGRISYLRMIVIIAVLTIIKPFEFINWYEYHKSLVSTYYIFLFFGMYALLHYMLKSILHRYYNTDTWTLRKEFRVLLFYFPFITCGNCLYADFTIPEFELTLHTFLDFLLYNGTLSFVTIPALGFYVDTKLQPKQPIGLTEPDHVSELISHAQVVEPPQAIEPTLSTEPKENTKSTLHLTEEQELKILQILHTVMETEQLFLSNKCSEQKVATHTNIPLHHISYAINTYSEYNFNDFVNKYRVEQVCRILQNEHDKKPILKNIGFECGFSCKGTYYAAFRKFTGKTPAQYLADLKNQSKTE
jgi:AraC-like DNA-binding protein